MCDKEAGSSQQNPQPVAERMPKVLVQRAEEIFPALKENMVSVLYMLGIVLSCSLMTGFVVCFTLYQDRIRRCADLFHFTSSDLDCALGVYNTYLDTHNSMC